MRFLRCSKLRSKLYGFGRLIYNRRKKTIFGKPPLSLLYLFIFLIILYTLFVGISTSEYFLIEFWIKKVQINSNSSATTDILENRLGLKFVIDLLNKPPSGETFDKYVSSYIAQYQNFSKLYTNSFSNLTNICAQTYMKDPSPSCFKPITDPIYNACVSAYSNLNETNIPYWMTLSRVLNFNPNGLNNPNFIAVKCNVTSKLGTSKEVNVFPSNGINRNQLPYRNLGYLGGTGQPMPLICTVVDTMVYDFLSCWLEAEGVKVESTGGPTNYNAYVRVKLPKFSQQP